MKNIKVKKTVPCFKRTLLSTIIAMSVMNVNAEEVKAQNAEKKDQIEIIEVTGLRASILSAITAKRDADSVMDTINASDIGKFPDTNLAESLQRVTGVQIASDGAEGAQISIRGLDPTFTRVTVNGQAAGTSDPRAGFNFSGLGSEMALSLEVIKSVTAAHEEGGMGGTVNVKTRRPLSFDKPKLQVGAKATYEEFSEQTDPYISFLGANQFFDNKFGVLVSGKYSTRNYREDFLDVSTWNLIDVDGDGVDTDLGMGRMRQRSRDRESEKYDLTTTFQYRPTENSEYYFDVTYGVHDRGVSRDQYIEYDFNKASNKESNYESYTLIPNGNDFNTITAATFKNNTADLSLKDQSDSWDRTSLTSVLGGNWTTDNWLIEGAFSYAKGTTLKTSQYNRIKLDRKKAGLSLGYNVDPGYADNIGAPVPMSVFVYDGDGNQLDVSDPNFWSARLRDENEDCSSGGKQVKCTFAGGGDRDIYVTNASANLDFARDVEFGDISEIKFGGRYREREREAEQYQNTNPEGLAAFPDMLDMPGSFAGEHNNAFTSFPGLANPAMYDGQVPRDLVLAAGGVDNRSVFRAAEYLYALEKTAAVYAMANLEGEFNFKDLEYRANFGIRAVHTDNTSKGMLWEGEEDEGPKDSFDQTEANFKYWDILPSANIVLLPTEQLLLRFSAGKVMTRPELGDVTTSVKYSYVDRVDEETPLSVDDSIEMTLGNAQLEPFRAWQYDAAAEYYTTSGGLLNIGLFYKDIESFITDASVDVCGDPTGGGWLPGGEPGFVDGQCYFGGDDENGTIDYTQKVNGEGATIKGVEVGIQQVFTDYLPSPFDGLGVQANYTYVDSTSPLRDRTTNEPLPMTGVSEDSYNLVLFYEKYDFSGRIAYNYRSEYLVSNTSRSLSGEGVMRDERGQLDASVSYDINKHFSISLSGVNLTDSVKMEYVGDESRLRTHFESGPRYQLGFRWKM
tara:strand:+ start:27 stop:2906 length:2880 start_codon:yes stop_codon:yes gene_type:complete